MANTTLADLRSQVLSNLAKSSSTAISIVNTTINTAHKHMVRMRDFPELLVTDVENAKTLVTLNSSGWVLHSGTIYKQTVVGSPVVVYDDGVEMTKGSSITLSAGEWYLSGNMLYVRLSDDSNPVNSIITVIKKSYHLTDDLGLTRPKDVYSIRLISGTNSRRLKYISWSKLDSEMPYPEVQTRSKSEAYTRFGNYVELIKIPDQDYPLWIRYSQWPATLSNDTDETSFENKDDVIIAYSTAFAFLAYEEETQARQWFRIADNGMKAVLYEMNTLPDKRPAAESFDVRTKQSASTDYWNNPFISQVE